MAVSEDQKMQFLIALQQHANQIVAVTNDASDLLKRWFDLGFSGEFEATDFEASALNHLDATVVTNAVSTLEAISTLMDAGHRANLNKVIR